MLLFSLQDDVTSYWMMSLRKWLLLVKSILQKMKSIESDIGEKVKTYNLLQIKQI